MIQAQLRSNNMTHLTMALETRAPIVSSERPLVRARFWEHH